MTSRVIVNLRDPSFTVGTTERRGRRISQDRLDMLLAQRHRNVL